MKVKEIKIKNGDLIKIISKRKKYKVIYLGPVIKPKEYHLIKYKSGTLGIVHKDLILNKLA